MKIVGICGPMGVGKTTLAYELSRYGYVRRGFSDVLKYTLTAFVKAQGASTNEAEQMFYGKLKNEPSIYFNGQTARHAMQTLGTEWGRELIDQNLWIEAWARSLNSGLSEPSDKFVTDDVRFLNEAQKIKELGGKIILLIRRGYQPSHHKSEREYLQIDEDLMLRNDGDQADLIRNFHSEYVRVFREEP